MQNIYLEPGGEFVQNEDLENYFDSKNELTVPFLNNEKISFSLFRHPNDNDFFSEAEKLLREFFQLTLHNRNKISDSVLQNCHEFLESIEYDEDKAHLSDIQNGDEIWQFVSPTTAQVKRDYYNSKKLFILVYCDCGWEDEHGLQITIKEGMTVTAVAEIDCDTRDDGLEIKLLEN